MNVASVQKAIIQHLSRVRIFQAMTLLSPQIKLQKVCANHVLMEHIALEITLLPGLTIEVTTNQINCCFSSVQSSIAALATVVYPAQHITPVANTAQVFYVEHVRLVSLFQCSHQIAYQTVNVVTISGSGSLLL